MPDPNTMTHAVGLNVGTGADTEGTYSEVGMTIDGRYISGKLPGGTRGVEALQLLLAAVHTAVRDDGPQSGD